MNFNFLKDRASQVLLAVLALHVGAFQYFNRPEPPVNARPLAEFPKQVDNWDMVSEYPVEPEVQAVLKADDTLSRSYTSPQQDIQAGFFIAFFRSQQSGQAPHSPKNCLPGSGWEPRESGTLKVSLGGASEPIEVNRYLIQRGDSRAMVLYWYQSHGRVVASEYMSKIYLVWDSIRLGRSDTALVRIVIPVVGSDEAGAEKKATEFVRAAFGRLSNILPS